MEQQQEQSAGQRLQEAIEKYAKISLGHSYTRHGGQEEKFEEFWQIAQKHDLQLTDDSKVLIGGRLPDAWVGRQRSYADVEEQFFNWSERQKQQQPESATSSANPASTAKTSTKAAEAERLAISQAQANSASFMRKCGPQILEAIRLGKVVISDVGSVSNPEEIAEFLKPKSSAPSASVPQAAPVKRTKQISQAHLTDRRAMAKLDAEWKSEGGILKAIQRGDVEVMR